MKIVQNDEKILKIQQTSFLPLLGFLFLGTILTFVSANAILLLAKISLNCQKVESDRNQCQLTINRLLGTEKRTFSESIKKAEMDVKERSYSTKGPDYSYGIVLITETKKITLSRIDSFSRKETVNSINKINAFINNKNQKSLTISRDNPIFVYAFLWLVLFFGIIFLLTVLLADLKTTLLFKKSDRELEIKRLKIYGYFTKKYSFSGIDCFLTETKTKKSKV